MHMAIYTNLHFILSNFTMSYGSFTLYFRWDTGNFNSFGRWAINFFKISPIIPVNNWQTHVCTHIRANTYMHTFTDVDVTVLRRACVFARGTPRKHMYAYIHVRRRAYTHLRIRASTFRDV
jgi:hypothetical protein